MQDSTCLLTLFQQTFDRLSSRCLFFTFPTVTFLHLNNRFCLLVPPHRRCFFSKWNLPFCVRQVCTSQQCHYWQGNQLTRKKFGDSFEQCNSFSKIPKPQYLFKFEIWWIICGHPVYLLGLVLDCRFTFHLSLKLKGKVKSKVASVLN